MLFVIICLIISDLIEQFFEEINAMNIGSNILITGGLGFIGSYFAEKISLEKRVIILDNFSANSKEAYEFLNGRKNITIFDEDILFCDYANYLPNINTVFHFAANSDISSGVDNPQVDFEITTKGTHRLLTSMQKFNVKNLIYPSGSGVYGDVKETTLSEKYGPLEPVSFYGASKLSAESYISSFCHMTDLEAKVFRFANVIGFRQTHGVAYDLIRKLKNDPSFLEVKGNGFQSKSYIHVDDIFNGIMTVLDHKNDKKKYEVFNLATNDYITVKEIVSAILNSLELSETTKVVYGNTSGGWLGDVPVVRFDTNKIRKLGWKNQYNSKEAMDLAIDYLIKHDFS